MGSPEGMSSLTTGNSSPIIDHHHPLYMYLSDAPGSLSAVIELVGTETYTIWSRAMKGLSSISEYFSRIKDLWDEYDSPVPPSSCDCAKSRDSLINFERQRLYQFLMGLNDSYGHAHSQILMMKPMPNINQVYSMLMQDESQKQLAGGIYVLTDKVDPAALFVAGNGGQEKKPIL
ncbi:PREDICTED: uncharacterized protein LOC109244868 [Nicotiana attenuata]|uniref:uncharacterized protein LOC109244868 n=1 Tax=Nicotiana attenuata TaxID=49451 RepID=UPI000904AE62|nr:PREDICTED: uncharacterized protein LOC109244868 [Nicotiana attenuata]